LAWASAVVVTPACVLSAVEDTKPDTFMLACFAGGLVFLIRHTRRGATPDLVLAGIGLGLAFGSRWYGVTAVAVVVAVWAVARLLARVPLRSVVRQTLAVSGLVALMGGFWLLRNWIVAGNPVLPVKVALGGTVLFDAPADYVRTKGGFTILHYATDGAVWRDYLWPAFRNGFVLTGIVAFVACLVVLLGAVRRRRGTLDMVLVAAAAATLLLTLVYAATPYSAQGPDGSPVQALVNTRYGLPALVTGAAVAAAIGAWGRRWSLVVTLLGLVGVIDGVTRVDNAGLLPYFAHVARPTRVLEALVLLGLAAVAVLVVRWSPRSLRAVVVVAIALLVGLAGYYHQRHYIDHRYLGADPSIDAVLEMPGRHTIAITGPTPPGILPPNLPLNGPRLDNRVRVLGRPDRYVLQPLRSSADLASSLRGEPYDLLYVLVDPAKPPKEVRWARALGWRQIAQGRTSVLFRRG